MYDMAAATDRASMRPRHEGRGERTEACRHRLDDAGLQCGHGTKAVENRHATRTAETGVRCFNAATARRPWRTRRQGPACYRLRPLQCGHGTKAVENRVRRRHGLVGPRRASMRPRHEGRGERASASARSPTWAGLQCGHGTKAVENALRELARRELPSASMRPRHEGRGERSSGGIVSATQTAASMRPRHEGRGERTRSTANDPPHAQSFNAATARRPWRTGPVGPVAGGGGRCFNAATARRPWRTKRIRPLNEPISLASMRPRHEGRGEPSPSVRAGGYTRASMRPRHEGRGEPRPWHRAGDTRPPASMRPRHEGRGEPGIATATCCAATGASMRPRHEGRGERNWCRPATFRRRRASMRPRHEGRGELTDGAHGRMPVARLQCGHGTKAVENTVVLQDSPRDADASMRPRHEGRGERGSACRTATVVIVLQCGHGTKAVENTNYARCTYDLSH